jgi:hypothetical protein
LGSELSTALGQSGTILEQIEHRPWWRSRRERNLALSLARLAREESAVRERLSASEDHV